MQSWMAEGFQALRDELEPLFRSMAERMQAVEKKSIKAPPSPPSSVSCSSSERSSSSSSQSGFEDGAAFAGVYVPINADDNPHWNAHHLAADPNHEPRRYSLYTNRTMDSLNEGRHEGGGQLGHGFSYAEPLCLWMHAANAYLAQILELQPEAGEFLYPLLNSYRAIYNLANQYRHLIVEKARAVKPGATDYDKSESKFVERAMDERDFATADVPAAIAELKADFAFSARKADLNVLARRAGGSGGGAKKQPDKERDLKNKKKKSSSKKSSERSSKDGSRGEDDRSRRSEGGTKSRDESHKSRSGRDGDKSDRGGKRSDRDRGTREDRTPKSSSSRGDGKRHASFTDSDAKSGNGKGGKGFGPGKGGGDGRSKGRPGSSKQHAEERSGSSSDSESS